MKILNSGHGVCLSGTCHDPAVHAWAVCLDALLGPENVYAERIYGRGSLEQWMAGPGAGLAHRPDIVLRGFDGPQSFTLLGVRTGVACVWGSGCVCKLLVCRPGVSMKILKASPSPSEHEFFLPWG